MAFRAFDMLNSVNSQSLSTLFWCRGSPDLLNVDSVVLSVSFNAKFRHSFGSLDVGFDFGFEDKTLKLFYYHYFKVYQ
ncbi:unnamed protein product [Rhizophagus irregularis]|nr:unnamed protein product [Rhizophagus irregularis]